MLSPNLPLTVDREFWEAMASETSVAFADSYLSGARLKDGMLQPHTLTAWGRLTGNRQAMSVIVRSKVKLVKPPRFAG